MTAEKTSAYVIYSLLNDEMMPGAEREHVDLAYRAHKLGEDGHVRTSTVISADSEGDAIAQACGLVDDHPIELGDQARLVIRITVKPKRSPQNF